jgi:uncharacterized protein (DUF2141 family)
VNGAYDVTNNTGSFTGLADGTYTLSVIALATGSTPACTTSVPSQTIYRPSTVTATVAKTNFTCNGANDGTITVSNATGGVQTDAPTRTYQYMIAKSGGSITGPQVSASFTGLTAGTYTVSVVAVATGSTPACTTSVSTQTIYDPNTVTATVAKTNITCNGANDGTITVSNAAGGIQTDAATRTYQYMISKSGGATTGPQESASFAGLTAGTYTVSVVALATGSTPACTTNVSTQTIYNPTTVTATPSKTNITCNTATDGSITISGAAGGTHTDAGSRTYNYRAVNGAYDVTNSTGSFTGLADGTYTLSVIALETGSTPACTTSVPSQTIYRPSTVTATTAKTDISCNTSNDGVITVTNTAGGTHTDAATRTYKYMIAKVGGGVTGPQSSGTFPGLGAGEYAVSVIAEATGSTPACTTQVSTQNIYEPVIISATVAKSNITCNGSINGSITVSNPQGGTHTGAPGRTYQYSIVKQGGTIPLGPQASGSFTDLAAGTYNVFVTALATGTAPSCSTLVSTQVINEPTTVTASSSKTDITCNGAADGIITITGAAGGTHADAATRTYNYMLIKSGTNIGPQASATFNNLTAGTYTVHVIALATGSTPACTTQVNSLTIAEPTAINAAPAVTSNYNGSQLSCPLSSDGAISSNPSGGVAPYTYLWEKLVGQNWTTVATTQNVANQSAGDYRVKVTDVNGCNITKTVSIIAPTGTIVVSIVPVNTSCNNTTDGTITVTAGGGTGAKTYSKDNGVNYQTSNVFTDLAPGSYQIVVKDANGCTSALNPEATVISAPPAITISSLTTNGPKNVGQSIEFTAVISGGTQNTTGDKYSYTWTSVPQNGQTPVKGAETVGASVTQKFSITTTTTNDNGTYTLRVTDKNGCTQTANVSVIIYPSTIYVSTTGNDATGNGLASNPLRTIQKANDIATAGNTIEVQAGTFDESPVISKALTINGTATSQLGSGKFFVYGTGSTITWGNTWSSTVFSNVGINANGTSNLQTAFNKVTAGSGATLWFIGSHTLTSTLTVNKQIALRGATASAGVPTYTGCDIEPPASITYTGTGSDSTLFVFTGSATKGLRDLTLKIPNAGQFASIPSGSSGNVDPVENVRFEWDHDASSGTAHRRIYGVTNGSFSGTDKFDVAKFVYDVEDNGYGTGRFAYGNNGPLPWNTLATGWKAEDGGTNTNLATIKTLEPMKSTVKLQSLVSATRRPTLYTADAAYNDKFYMDFDGVDEYLEGNTTADINGGSQKTLFVVFRPKVSSADQVVYKHGDEDQGMSVVHLSDGRISLNVYEGTAAGTRESWIYEADATHASTEFDNQVLIAQIYFNGNGDNNTTRRVGASLDNSSGRMNTDINHTGADKDNGYVGNGAFTPATLTTPALIGPANVVVMGSRSGSMYYASWDTGLTPPAAANNSFTTTGRSLFYDGSIAEVVILNDASITARDAAYCYLRNKYYSGNQSVDNGLNKGVIAGEERDVEESVVAWPNPAEDEITIEAMIPQSGNVIVTLRDALSRPVQQLFEGFVVGGTQMPINANVRDVISGAYLIHVQGAGDLNLSLPIIIRH